MRACTSNKPPESQQGASDSLPHELKYQIAKGALGLTFSALVGTTVYIFKNADADLKGLKTQVGTQELRDTQTELRATKAKVDDLTQENAKQQNALGEAKVKVAEQQIELRTTRAKVHDLTQELAKQTEQQIELGVAKAKVDDLTQQLAKQTEKQIELGVAKAKVDDLTQKLASQTEQLAELRKARSDEIRDNADNIEQLTSTVTEQCKQLQRIVVDAAKLAASNAITLVAANKDVEKLKEEKAVQHLEKTGTSP